MLSEFHGSGKLATSTFLFFLPTFSKTRAIPAWILSWEPHNVPAVDNMIEIVVKTERLIICVLMIVEGVVNNMRRSALHARPSHGLQIGLIADGCLAIV